MLIRVLLETRVFFNGSQWRYLHRQRLKRVNSVIEPSRHRANEVYRFVDLADLAQHWDKSTATKVK
jgi:hypothetical protein